MLWLALIAASPSAAQTHMTEAVEAGRSLVAHVTVALADSEHQGIGPVSGNLGDGMRPEVNLYWGALYGVEKFLPKKGWRIVERATMADPRILSRVIFERRVKRDRRTVRVVLIADAWAGPHIRDATIRYFEHAAGRDSEIVTVGDERVAAGGSAHVVAYIGHNGLMDFDIPEVAARGAGTTAAIALACISKDDFLPILERVNAEPILLTKSLMAPEAYTLDAALVTWFAGGTSQDVYVAGSDAYCVYQKCSTRTARKMFWAAP